MVKIHVFVGLLLTITLACFTASSQEKKTKRVIHWVIVRNDSVIAETQPWYVPDIPFDTLKVRRNWSALERGLSEDSVRSLLGASWGIMIDGESGMIYWWYGRRAVIFNSVTKRVSGWDSRECKGDSCRY